MDSNAAVNIPLLAGLKPRDREAVLRSAREQRYAPGEVVVAEGDPATRLYVVVSGSARVERADVGQVGRLQPGDFFGELALIEEHGRTASVVAETELTCLLIPAWEFKALLEEHPQMALPMMKAMIARLHRREHHGY
jgi:CRP-like cAMP-binding protein